MRESSEKEKTKLPGDTYEEWLSNQTWHPPKAKGHETNTPTSYDLWIGKRVQSEIQRSRAKAQHESRAPKRKVRK